MGNTCDGKEKTDSYEVEYSSSKKSESNVFSIKESDSNYQLNDL